MDREEINEPIWVPRVVVLGAQFDQLQQHGGAQGTRDGGSLLDAALAHPRTQFGYQERPDLASLAAAYAYGIAKVHHPFNDGNKRTGFVVAAIFLALNGADLDAPEGEVVDVMQGVADGTISEAQLAEWIRQKVER